MIDELCNCFEAFINGLDPAVKQYMYDVKDLGMEKARDKFGKFAGIVPEARQRQIFEDLMRIQKFDEEFNAFGCDYKQFQTLEVEGGAYHIVSEYLRYSPKCALMNLVFAAGGR